MRIIDLSPGWTQALWVQEYMEDHYERPGIEFNDRGIANVKQDVGEALVEDDRFDIEEYDPDYDYDFETIAPHLFDEEDEEPAEAEV